MAMTAGSVVIAPDGSETKSGMAEAIYDAFITNYAADTGVPLPGTPEAVVPIKRAYAALATRVASGVVDYIAANAKAQIRGGLTGGLQNTPSPNNPATPTDPPAGDQYLNIV